MTISLTDLKAKRAAMTQGEWRLEMDRNDQQNIHTDDLWIALLPHQCVTSIEQEQERNATGIVATHNAADCLIEFADAALELDKLKVANDSNLSRWNGKLDAAERRYLAALAKIKP